MREYKIQETLPGRYAITFEEDGRVWSIPEDPSNSEYQQYLIDTDGGLPLPEEQA